MENAKPPKNTRPPIAAISPLVAPALIGVTAGLAVQILLVRTCNPLPAVGLMALFFVLALGGSLLLGRHPESLAETLAGFTHRAGQDERTARMWQEEIKHAENEGDYLNAVNLRRSYIDTDLPPNKSSVAFRIALAFEDKLGRPQDALYWYRKTKTLSGADGPYLSEAEAGIRRLTAVSFNSPHDRDQRERHVKDAIEKQDWEAAEAACVEMRRLYPEDPAAVFLRGAMASRRGNHALAMAHYQQACEMAPDDEKAAFNLGVSMVKAGRDVEAREAWTAYLKRFADPDSSHTDVAESTLAELKERLKTTADLGVTEPVGSDE